AHARYQRQARAGFVGVLEVKAEIPVGHLQKSALETDGVTRRIAQKEISRVVAGLRHRLRIGRGAGGGTVQRGRQTVVSGGAGDGTRFRQRARRLVVNRPAEFELMLAANQRVILVNVGDGAVERTPVVAFDVVHKTDAGEVGPADLSQRVRQSQVVRPVF